MRIQVKDMQQMIEHCTRHKDLIYRIIHKRILQHIDSDVDSVFLFDYFLTDYSIVVSNVAFRTEWLTCLELAIKYFEEAEEYETCIEIMRTMVLLRDRIKLLK
jgi:hypothetical protein